MRLTRARIHSCLLVVLLGAAAPADAYSVLAHEALIDTVWDDELVPLLRRRFPSVPAEALRASRAYAYGGSLIQDLGYYPFGSRLFSNLLHYVRSGDFVQALVRHARDPNELAFALGALAHYTSDNVGHPVAVNRAVPLVYPKLARTHGPEVLYADSPARHIMVEFAFDVLQAARGTFVADAYQERIGFQVAEGLLERAFRDTYGLALDDLFGDAALAIGTYRHAVSRVIPDVTRMAWREKRDEILEATPDITERRFVVTMTRRQYEDAFGSNYRKPSLLARIVVAIFKIVPKFGPFKPLAFEPLTPAAERMFLDSFSAARAQYVALLRRAREGTPGLSDTDLDTGAPPARGRNRLADETYDDLLAELAESDFLGVPAALRRAINQHYAHRVDQPRKLRKGDRKAARHLAALNATRSN